MPSFRKDFGFSLIELMIVVAIIGILAAIALPSYQDYAVRSRVSELIQAASSAKTAIAERYQINNDASTAGIGVTVPVTGKVTASDVTSDGIVTVNGSTAASSVGANVTVTIKPNYGSNGSVTWSCIGSPSRYMPSSCVSLSAQAIPIPPVYNTDSVPDPARSSSSGSRSGSGTTPTPPPAPDTPRCWDGVSRDANGAIQTVAC
jgi:type IV pilus assembly protein PilA